jgi:NitT/TauT family transport system ATP-binding protein
MAPILSAKGIGLSFPNASQPVLKDFDLVVAPGEFVAIVGGSGVGKSTLLRVVAGLIEPNTGSVTVTTSAAPDRRRRAIVFQDGRLMPWRDLRGNIGYGLEGLKMSAATRRGRVDDVMKLTGLSHLADRYPHQLSGGQIQRGGIARALAVQPDLLLYRSYAKTRNLS